VFIFKEGLPAFTQVGLWQFLTGTRWSPSKGVLGILPMIVGSFLVTAGALLIGLPLGLGLCHLFVGICHRGKQLCC
jgi:phosphate transport system permease protein